MVQHGPAAIRWLIDQEYPSRRKEHGKPPAYHLTREGGHSQRLIHAADATGQAIETTPEARAHAHPRTQLFEHHIAIDLLTRNRLGRTGANRCLGAYVLDKTAGRVRVFGAPHVVLATGGASKVYLYTTNPDTSTGHCIPLAWRSVCRVPNMAFVQFHPTCLYHPGQIVLISETARRGGRCVRTARRSCKNGAPAELAPRDVVARRDYEMKRRGIDCVYLDISHKPIEFIQKHFPTIYQRC